MRNVTACASSANLGPGFDHISIALSSFHETLDLSIKSGYREEQVTLLDSSGNRILKAPSIVTVKQLLSDYGVKTNVVLRTSGNIPWGAGLGSSGAASVATVMAADKQFALELTDQQMVEYSLLGEEYVAGAKHADNVIASLFGDLTLITSVNPLRYRKFKVNPELSIFLITPSFSLMNKTRRSRELLNRNVSISDASENAKNLAVLLQGLLTGEMDLIREGMNDVIVEPLRSSLYPFYYDLKRELVAKAEVGVALSGGGPSVICIGSNEVEEKSIRKASQRILGDLGIGYNVTRTSLCGGGLNERRNNVFC